METFIRWYDNALDGDSCRRLIARFEDDPDRFAGLVAANKGNVLIEGKQTTELVIEKAGWEDLAGVLRENLFQWFPRYQREVKFLAGSDHRDLEAEALRIKKYERGGRFDWHIDNNCRRNFRRVLAVQWYFNTVDEGGHTEFEDQPVRIAPVEGRLAFFPVGWMYRHRGAPVLSGPKYICTTFIRPLF